MKKFSIETTYIKDEVAHTAVYTAEECAKAKFHFQLIREKEPSLPIRLLANIDGKTVDVRKGDEYNFDDLSLTVDVKTDSGSVLTYLCRKHIRGSYIIKLHLRNGTTKEIGCTVLETKRRTEEQMMNLRNEKNFDKFWFIEDVIVKSI